MLLSIHLKLLLNKFLLICKLLFSVLHFHAQGEGPGPVSQGSGSEGTAEGQAGGDP